MLNCLNPIFNKSRRFLILLLFFEIVSFLPQTIVCNPTFAQPNLRLGISADKFTINNQPSFLLGVSYFDGRNFYESDLINLASRGFNLIRIWLDWREDYFFDENGNWHSDADQDLIRLVDFADSQGLVVDVTVLDIDMSFGDSPTKRRVAVESVARLLKDKTNVLFDLVNEHDHTGYNTIVTHNEAASLGEVVRSIDPDRIITISSTGCHILCGDDNDDLIETNILEEINDIGVDVLTPHFLRTNDWAANTGQRVIVLKNYLLSLGKNIPLYLQEEARRNDNSGPTAEDFFVAAEQALKAGAAGWIFHTGAGYELKGKNFFENLDPVEQIVVNELAERIFENKQEEQDNTPPSPPTDIKIVIED